MSNPATPLIDQITEQDLPYLRRYARALTGSRQRGDQYAIATLEALKDAPAAQADARNPRVALFRTFHSIWVSSGGAMDDAGEGPARSEPLDRLTGGTREALLLATLENLSFAEIGAILQIDPAEASRLVDIAYDEMARAAPGKVLVIEDEPIIAVDLEGIVAAMGHKITGVAATQAEAVALADAERPDLILSDIQLADYSSGVDAVAEIVAAHGDIPVVFITAYPERMLTGEGAEPAFVISKPYREAQVRSALSQAMFFSGQKAP